MVAMQQKDRDAGLPQTPHLTHEKEPGVEVLPVAVIHITRDHHEVDRFREGMVDEVAEGVAGGGAQPLRGRIGIGRQASQRTVEMKVGCMDESHRRGTSARMASEVLRTRRPGRQ